jgi:GntR family transcriptional repressor for pyruvate dehydrogenase complex
MEEIVSFNLSKITRNPLYEQVSNNIIQRIIDERLADGTKIPSERSLSEQFGVSRVVIREAMKVLVKNGMVVVEPGRGTFIADQTSNNLHTALDLVCRIQGIDDYKVMEIRFPLEILAAELAAQRADHNDIKALAVAIDECETNFKDVKKFILSDEKFHLELAEAAKNELLLALLHPLVEAIQILRAKTASLPNATMSACNCHEKIFNAIKNHDVKAAQAAMREHMEITSDLLYQVMSLEQKTAIEGFTAGRDLSPRLLKGPKK